MLRIGVDLDGTILRYKTASQFDLEGNLMPYGKFGELIPGAKEALTGLHEEGHEIVIITNRTARAMIHSYLSNTLRIPFDRIVSQANDLGYDIHIGAGCVDFQGNWTKALTSLKEVLTHGTWEEKRLKGKVAKGVHPSIKGYL